MGEFTVRAAGKADIRPLAAALAAAFEEDPQFLWALKGLSRRRARLERIFTTLLRWECLPHRAVDLIAQGADVLGGALWLPPGKAHPPLPRQLAAATGFLRGYGRGILRGNAFQSASFRAHPREPHWYLYVIGVRPEHQGAGLSSRLLRPRLDAADAAGLPAYLESSNLRNVPLYEHFGFEVTGRLQLPAGAPEIPTMWRSGAARGEGSGRAAPGG
ncbi:GNAT family N-acetyltransferase [Streptacidiphilus monticola]|uniref:GNAT family N-acetyltransferase n=1 Tax=Streptacidiphilus monticola TaxID=2161674 RepID=A0ABW1FYX1_9ACTN